MHIIHNTVTIQVQVRVVPYVHVQLFCKDAQRRGEQSPGGIAAAIVRSKRARHEPVDKPPSTNNKKKKKSRKQVDDDSEEDERNTSQSQNTVTSSTSLQKSASTTSRASENGTAQKVGSASSAELITDAYTSPKTVTKVYVSSAERVPPNKRVVQKNLPTRPMLKAFNLTH
jgi:hypothetical protein